MCGLVGWVDPAGAVGEGSAQGLIAVMRDRLAHRGPDDFGTWLDPRAGVALGFRRLAILDLSSAGHQPMLSADGRFALVMNGEVYNFAEMRAEVEAAGGPLAWRGRSDTEVLVEAIALWGVEAALKRANGMFALAVWDRRKRVLHLARDRIGKKPLYYGWAGSAFVFASELKALWPHPGFEAEIDAGALADYLRLGYVPGARTIFRAVSKLRPGEVLRLDPSAARALAAPCPSAYWSLREAALAGLDAQAGGEPAPGAEAFEALLEDAVGLRLAADVPVGSFLSGGIDSSLVTALMAARSPRGVRSFAVGFEGTLDEAPHAAAIAAHLGTAHETLYIGADDALALVGDLPAIYDEPFADDSMVPTALLCRLARSRVTVALSGDGGDELFAGYDKYAEAARWLARRDAAPDLARSLAGTLASATVAPLARAWGGKAARRAHLLGTLLAADRDGGGAERFNTAIMAQTLDPERLMAAPPRRAAVDAAEGLGRGSAIDRLTFMDASSYLTDDILVKVDRASMAASLEVRCPLLDYRLIEMSWRFPTAAKTKDGVGKLPLRAALHRRVPSALVERPKQGFGAPVEVWLRGGLRPWAEALMSRTVLARSGLLDVAACRQVWEGFAERGRAWDPVIWRLLMFQAWHAWMTQALASAPAPTAQARPHAAAAA